MRRFVLAAVICSGVMCVAARSQESGATKAPQVPASAKGVGAGDPLAIGKGAMQRGDYDAAHRFFSEYVKANPTGMEAVFFLGGSELGLGNYGAAAADFEKIVAVMPNQWSAHNNLALAYAQSSNWVGFDKERALIKTARDSNAPGVDKDDFDLIDRVTVGDKTYDVRAYYKLHGQYNVRYAFLHFGKDGRPDSWVQCESDDADQMFFAQQFPEKAKAGDRKYSLDIYSAGQNGLSQGLIRFYNGEPTYETVRADAIKSLAGKAAPGSTSTTPKR